MKFLKAQDPGQTLGNRQAMKATILWHEGKGWGSSKRLETLTPYAGHQSHNLAHSESSLLDIETSESIETCAWKKTLRLFCAPADKLEGCRDSPSSGVNTAKFPRQLSESDWNKQGEHSSGPETVLNVFPTFEILMCFVHVPTCGFVWEICLCLE